MDFEAGKEEFEEYETNYEKLEGYTGKFLLQDFLISTNAFLLFPRLVINEK
jgi:hypothetical protein